MTDEPIKAINVLYDGVVSEMNLNALNAAVIAGVVLIEAVQLAAVWRLGSERSTEGILAEVNAQLDALAPEVGV